MEASEMNELNGDENSIPMNRAKSEMNLLKGEMNSMEVSTETCHVSKALYAYLSSGDNQLSFHEGDLLRLIGTKN